MPKNKKTSKAKKVITVAQNGNTHAKARDNLKMTYFGTDYQSTGIVAKPGEEFVVYVQVEENVPLPTIAFSQHEGFYSNWVRWYQLKPGKNVITVPEIYSNSWEKKTAKGGAVVGIVQENDIPVKFIGVGEQIDDMEIFNSKDFAKAII